MLISSGKQNAFEYVKWTRTGLTFMNRCETKPQSYDACINNDIMSSMLNSRNQA